MAEPKPVILAIAGIFCVLLLSYIVMQNQSKGDDDDDKGDSSSGAPTGGAPVGGAPTSAPAPTSTTKTTMVTDWDSACATNITCDPSVGDCSHPENMNLTFHNDVNQQVSMSYKDYQQMTNGMAYWMAKPPAERTCQNLNSKDGAISPFFEKMKKKTDNCFLRAVTSPMQLNVAFSSGGGGNWDFNMCGKNRLHSKVDAAKK